MEGMLWRLVSVVGRSKGKGGNGGVGMGGLSLWCFVAVCCHSFHLPPSPSPQTLSLTFSHFPLHPPPLLLPLVSSAVPLCCCLLASTAHHCLPSLSLTLHKTIHYLPCPPHYLSCPFLCSFLLLPYCTEFLYFLSRHKTILLLFISPHVFLTSHFTVFFNFLSPHKIISLSFISFPVLC